MNDPLTVTVFAETHGWTRLVCLTSRGRRPSALDAGATPAEVVAVLLGVASVVGMPCVVGAAPKVALALGYDTEDALEGVNDAGSRRSAAK